MKENVFEGAGEVGGFLKLGEMQIWSRASPPKNLFFFNYIPPPVRKEQIGTWYVGGGSRNSDWVILHISDLV